VTIKKRTTASLTTADPVDLPTLGLGASFGRLVAIRAHLYSSSAKSGNGADNTGKLRITDGNSDIVYLDANNRDFTTGVTLYPIYDDTFVGTGPRVVDANGTASAAGTESAFIIMQSPVVVRGIGFGTTTEYLEVQLLVEV
jgi:hypothetical protein